MNPAPSPLTAEEQQALRDCETEIRAALDKYSCDIQGIANISTGNVVVNCVIVKVRPAPADATAPAAASGVGAAAGAADAPAGPAPAALAG